MALQTISLFLLFFISILNTSVWALPDATIAARASVGVAQELLASPPLPSLESGGGITFAPQIGTSKVTTEDTKYFEATTAPSAPAYMQYHTGELKGNSAALSLSGPPHGQLGWFAFAVGSQLSGDVHAYQGSSPTFSLIHIKTTVIGGAAGISYRFIGESNSPFAMGFFFGPAFMNVRSSFDLVQHDVVTADQKYSMNPTLSAAYSGLQLKMRFKKFLINPYFLYMKELNQKCKEINLENGTSPCVELDTSFTGYGMYLGYGAFRARVYSAVTPSPTMSDLKFSGFSISYAFDLTNGR